MKCPTHKNSVTAPTKPHGGNPASLHRLAYDAARENHAIAAL